MRNSAYILLNKQDLCMCVCVCLICCPGLKDLPHYELNFEEWLNLEFKDLLIP